MPTGFDDAWLDQLDIPNVPDFSDPNFNPYQYDGADEWFKTHRETTEVEFIQAIARKHIEEENKVAKKATIPLRPLHNQPAQVGAVPASLKVKSPPLVKRPAPVNHGPLRALPPKNAALQPIRNPAPKPAEKPAPLRNASKEILHKARPNSAQKPAPRPIPLHKRSHEILSKPAAPKPAEKSVPFHKRSHDLIPKPNPMRVAAFKRSHEVLPKVDPHKRSHDTLYRPKVVAAPVVAAPKVKRPQTPAAKPTKSAVVVNHQRKPPSPTSPKGSTKVDAGRSSVEAARAGEYFAKILRAYPSESNSSKSMFHPHHK